MAQSPKHGSVRKRIEFDAETWHALHLLAADSIKDLQELADEAFSDLLKKHDRSVGLKASLRASARQTPANDESPLNVSLPKRPMR